MKLIAESGSTKTIWKLKTDDAVETYETIGFNPLFISVGEIKEELGKSEMVFYKDKVKEIYFYGASCSSDARKKVIYDGLSFFFINATIVEVDHDLNAACIGLFGDVDGFGEVCHAEVPFRLLHTRIAKTIPSAGMRGVFLDDGLKGRLGLHILLLGKQFVRSSHFVLAGTSAEHAQHQDQ